jgi:isoquinoline 1-oxidoreductase beta subunit
MATRLSRRTFLAGSAGLTLAFAVDLRAPRGARAQGGPLKANVWVTIDPDGTVTIVSPAAEMGQGSLTGMPVIVAEELDADWAKVKILAAPMNRAFGNPGFGGLQVTGASRSTPGFWMPLRLAGAQARRVLLDAVAAEWKVPLEELTTEPHVVVHAKSGRRIAYGDVAKFAKAPAELPKVTPADLKKTEQFRLIGKSLPRVDIPDKVTGKAKFGIDSELPDMVVACVLRGPSQGDTPDTIDDTAAKQVAGVSAIVPLPWGVGVVGSGYEAVHRGKAALKVTWKKGRAAAYDSDRIRGDYAGVAGSLTKKGVVAHELGSAPRALGAAAQTFEAAYVVDHVYHATMEPMNALARVAADGSAAEVWAPTQSPSINQAGVAAVLKIAPDKVTIHPTLMGGGFGRRLENDFVFDAVMLSKATGKPVKVVWSREDDVKNDKYRPLVAQYLRAGLDAEGNLSAWHHRIVGASIYARFNPGAFAALKGADTPVIEGYELSYSCVNQLQEYLREERGLDVGLWRSVGPGYTKFAIESFIDEIARGQRIDPVQFRQRLLAHNPRAQAVVRRVADWAEWDKKRPAGRALGIGFSDTWRSYIASVVEISLDRKSGAIRVHEVWSVVDPGVAIQPDTVVAQIEGATIFGISAALRERIVIADGVVKNSNFHDYPLLRMAEAPEINVRVTSTDNAPGGIGEVGLPPIAPAIGNAVFALTGTRLRSLPMSPERVQAALRA